MEYISLQNTGCCVSKRRSHQYLPEYFQVLWRFCQCHILIVSPCFLHQFTWNLLFPGISHVIHVFCFFETSLLAGFLIHVPSACNVDVRAIALGVSCFLLSSSQEKKPEEILRRPAMPFKADPTCPYCRLLQSLSVLWKEEKYPSFRKEKYPPSEII